MTQWVAVDTSIGDDPRIWKLADSCGVSAEAAVGLHVMLLAKVSEHRPDGDLSVSDGLLEKWAGWRGMPYAFAPHYRALFLDAAGKLIEWDEVNGKHLKKLAKERERWHERNRDKSAEETQEPQQKITRSSKPSLRGGSAEPPPPTSHNTTSTSLLTAREQFLAGLNGSRAAWEARLTAWQYGGIHSLGATEAEVDKALEEYLLNGNDPAKPNARLLEAMIRKVFADRQGNGLPAALSRSARTAASDEPGEVAWGKVLSAIAGTPWRFLPRDTFDAREWKAINRVGGLLAIAERDLKKESYMKHEFVKHYVAAPADDGDRQPLAETATAQIGGVR